MTIGASEGAPDKGEISDSGAHYRPNPNHENGKEQRTPKISKRDASMYRTFKLGCVDSASFLGERKVSGIQLRTFNFCTKLGTRLSESRTRE